MLTFVLFISIMNIDDIITYSKLILHYRYHKYVVEIDGLRSESTSSKRNS